MSGLLSCAFMASVLFQGATQVDADKFFAEFTKARQGVQGLQARFEQTNTSGKDVVNANGTIVYVKPRRILFRYESTDQNAVYLIDNHKVFEYEPDVRQVQIYNMDENEKTEILFLGFDNDTESLRKNYDVSVVEPANKDAGSRALVIHPKVKTIDGKPAEPAVPKDPANPTDPAAPKKSGEREASSFREVMILLRDKDYIPVAIQIINQDDSEVLILMKDIALRDKADLSLATISLPEGTKIFENDEKKEVVGAGGKVVPAPDSTAKPLETGQVSSDVAKPAGPVKVEELSAGTPAPQPPAQKPPKP